MPELPEVEAVCRRLRDSVEGRRITGAQVSRCAPADLSALVAGKRLEKVERRGKHILLRLRGGTVIHVHLRMSGNLFAIPDHRLHSASARVVLRLAGGSGIVLEDPRALAQLEVLSAAAIDRQMARLGPEPLSAEFTPALFRTLARQSKQPAKLFLMDQRRVAGLGNIYAAEALYRARIDPRKPLARMKPARLESLYQAIVGILTDAVQSACKAYSGPGLFLEAEEFPLAVYGKDGEPCSACGRRIRRLAQGGRSTYFCPGCQR